MIDWLIDWLKVFVNEFNFPLGSPGFGFPAPPKHSNQLVDGSYSSDWRHYLHATLHSWMLILPLISLNASIQHFHSSHQLLTLSSVLGFTFKPCRYFTISSSPFWAAKCNGVFPSSYKTTQTKEKPENVTTITTGVLENKSHLIVQEVSLTKTSLIRVRCAFSAHRKLKWILMVIISILFDRWKKRS